MEKLRFKDENGCDYPEWEITKLGEVAEIYQPKTISKADFVSEGLYLVYGANGVIGKYNKYNHKQEQVLVSCRGAKSGALNYSHKESWITGNSLVVNIDEYQDIVNKRYVYCFLHNLDLNQLITGTAIPQITGASLKHIFINLPCFDEQTKISNYFSNLDSLINNKQRQLELMEKYKKDLLDKIFNQKIRFKDENGCDYPEWKTAKVKEIFNITRGNVISKILLDLTNNKNNFPVYSSQTKKEGIMGYYDKFLFQDSIIWTTDGANAGTTRYVDGKFYCSNVCGVLLRNTETPNTLFAELINTKTKRHITASVIPKFMNHAMAGLEITYPTSIEEQFKISKYISNLNLLINNLKLNIKNMQKLKLDMLEKMF